MSYKTWIDYGYGVCVDDIKTTPERLLKLAAMKPDVNKIVKDYLDEIYEDGYEIEDLTMDDFNDLEGVHYEYGVDFVLYNVIDGIPITYSTDYNGTGYILYTPTYPWWLKKDERNLAEEDVANVFRKYIQVLTDDPVKIDYYEVENGG